MMVEWLFQTVEVPLYGLLILAGIGEAIRAVRREAKRRRSGAGSSDKSETAAKR